LETSPKPQRGACSVAENAFFEGHGSNQAVAWPANENFGLRNATVAPLIAIGLSRQAAARPRH
ncbi:MAG: hypothetical protein WB755_09925, partial [Terriglobales bacterium]